MVKGTVKKERPVTVQIPRPAEEQPVWTRVGVIAAIGFVIGVAWPRLAGVRIGPSVPGDGRKTEAEATPTAAPALAPPPDTAAPETTPPPAEASRKNEQLVVVGPGSVTRCADKKNKKVDDCGELKFDAVALPKLQELAQCPSALGLEGKLSLGFDINFDKSEVQVVKGKKKSNLPSSTINGILQCAAREFTNVALDAIPHKHARYSLAYTATFYPPGKHPDEAGSAGTKPAEGEEGAAPSEDGTTGTADVAWDTALVRSRPKNGDVVLRLVRGTRIKLIGRENDWYKVEHRGKSGWLYRGAIGL
ncbi:SH3 domain-containing protein [Chondromyces crocatus]|uniref:SH3b domain-containing protein n=1 Tax=Chondromyces crocatus TaxID=52 RepID=A0A0K1EFU7_CHOCO|nr:SH3 domain-containing protein [Chondromyces crocatus]AKT39745.1 uncharacterized protein CMC5_038960 [Chondromyces crocatus]